MYAAVGFGSITATKVLSKILEEYRKTKPNTEIEEKLKNYIQDIILMKMYQKQE